MEISNTIKLLEINRHRSIISSNITNKNFLLVGKKITDISLSQQILTPETLEIMFKDLLEEKVYIGTTETYEGVFKNGRTNSAIGKLANYSISLPFYNKLNKLDTLFTGRYFNEIYSKKDLEINKEYQLNVTYFLEKLEKDYNLSDNRYYQSFKKICSEKKVLNILL